MDLIFNLQNYEINRSYLIRHFGLKILFSTSKFDNRIKNGYVETLFFFNLAKHVQFQVYGNVTYRVLL